MHKASFHELKKFMTKERATAPSDLKGVLEIVPIETSMADLSPSQSIPQSWFFDGNFLVNFPALFAAGKHWTRFIFDTVPAVRECREGEKNPTIRHSKPEIVEYDTLSGCFSATKAAQSFAGPDWTTFLVRLKN